MTITGDEDPVMQSSVLGTQIQFNLELVNQILQLPNEGDRSYLSAYHDLPTYSRTEAEAYSAISYTA